MSIREQMYDEMTVKTLKPSGCITLYGSQTVRWKDAGESRFPSIFINEGSPIGAWSAKSLEELIVFLCEFHDAAFPE